MVHTVAPGVHYCPAFPTHFRHSVDNAGALHVSLWGNEELGFEAKVVPWTAGRISDVPAVAITLANTALDRNESRLEREYV